MGNGMNYARGRIFYRKLACWPSRDPIGFGGRDFNLYRYVGNDPVNWADPEGRRQLTIDEKLKLAIFVAANQSSKITEGRPIPVNVVSGAVKDIRSAIKALKPHEPEPPALKALFYAIGEIHKSKWGKAGSVGTAELGHKISPIPSGHYKCNVFASNCFATGADLGYDTPTGVPAHKGLFPWSEVSVPSANFWADSTNVIRNFPVDRLPHVGDIAAFVHEGGEGHVAIYAGGGPFGLVIYAGPNFVKVQSISFVMVAGPDEYPSFRRYR
jgi:hypothetical protein